MTLVYGIVIYGCFEELCFYELLEPVICFVLECFYTDEVLFVFLADSAMRNLDIGPLD